MRHNPDRIRHIAIQMLETAKGNWEEAARLYHKHLSQHDEVKADLLDYAVRLIIREVARRSRHVKWNEQPSQGVPLHTRSVDKLVSTLLMEYPLRGGLLMKDARRPDLTAEGDSLEVHASSNAARARWFKAVCRQLPNDQVTVGEVLTERKLRQLKNATGAASA